MNKKIALSTIAGIALLMGTATPAQAGSTVGSCVNPQATLEQTNYSKEKVHGVFGVGAFAGTDLIYKSGNDILQCLCTVDGEGWESVWIDATDKDRASLRAEGFTEVTNPKSWGLKEDRVYYVKNVQYVCKAPQPTATPAPTSAPAATATPTQAPTPTATPAPVVEATKNVVNTIASTGNAFVIYASILAGAASLIAGMVLKRFSK